MHKKHLVQNKCRHVMGWKADRPDHNDKIYPVMLKVAHLPNMMDLRAICPPVFDQGEIGSCTANSSTSMMEALMIKLSRPLVQLSRLFLYYAERVKVEDGDPTDDSGAQIRDTMKSLATYGSCQETSWPYDTSKFSDNPPDAAWTEALQHKIISYYRLVGLAGIKGCLAEGYTCVIGFSVPENMESDQAAQTGQVQYPTADEQIIGGHAIHIVGYDDAKQCLIFQNSWGPDWGDKGFGYLPYQFVNSGLATDFWTVRVEE